MIADGARMGKGPPSTIKKNNNKKRQNVEARMIAAESKSILGRIADRNSSMLSRRAFAYEPTLDIFQRYSFSDYVRGALLGVDGVVDWDSSDSEDSGSDTDLGNDGNEDEGGGDRAAQISAPGSSPRGGPGKRPPSSSANPLTPTRASTRIKARRNHESMVGALVQKGAGANEGAEEEEEEDFGRSYRLRGGHGRCCKPVFAVAQPDEMLLADGIAKVTPPEGWWDYAGIGGDLTGRGPIWSEGGRLGEKQIMTPIKQSIAGIGGVYEFTNLEMPHISVHKFRDMADQYRKRQAGEEQNDDYSDEFMDKLARKFWKRLGPTMQPSVYGADMEGTLFDGDEACGWNVDRLESALALLGADMDDEGDVEPGEPAGRLPGVTTAYLYFGMWGSVFSAHTEDMNLLSINYLHAGAPKYWYAIDPKASKRFESLATSLFPAAARDCADFLRHKRYLISPTILHKHGIGYTTQVQRPGDAIITFPGAYHFGFNTGFNVAESTNFAVPEWLPSGREATVCLCHPHSVRIDMTRFQSLLAQYVTKCGNLRRSGKRVITYSEFARAEAAKRILMEELDEEKDGSGEDDGEDEEQPRYHSIRILEVMKMKTASMTAAALSRKAKGKKGRSKKRVAPPRCDFRRAKRAYPGSYHIGTEVLYFHSARALAVDDDASDEELDSRGRPSVKCFAGTVVDSCEGHVRIHFAGTPKKDDIWVKLDSLDLFIDAGPRDEDSDDDDAEAKAAKASPSKKGKAKSKGKKAAGKKRRAS